MLTRLALKELRETAWIAAAALLLYLYYFTDVTGMGRGYDERWRQFAFIADDPNTNLGMMVGLMLALGLGLRQTVGESARGTFQFLLHRPASRTQILGVKMLVGLGLCLALTVVPVLMIGCWAKSPGNLPAPFEWSMLATPWKAWPAASIVYLGAFLAGLRPGRWVGTRLLPAAAGIIVAMVLCFVPLPCWWAIGLPLVVIVDVLLARNILYVAATRDFS